MYCRNCGKNILENAVICVGCGTPIAMGNNFCQSCGNTTGANSTVCLSCGVRLFTINANEGLKSKIVAGVLGIFLGGLGIHRFYLGYVGIGVIQLVLTFFLSWFTCFVSAYISGIWGFIEGILILVGSINRDAQGKPLKD